MQFRLNLISFQIYPPQLGNLFLAPARKSDCIELEFLTAGVANVTIARDQLRYTEGVQMMPHTSPSSSLQSMQSLPTTQ